MNSTSAENPSKTILLPLQEIVLLFWDFTGRFHAPTSALLCNVKSKE